MIDHQTERRHDELNAWQKASINQILGASKPVKPASVLWRVLETLAFWLALFWIGATCLWVAAAVFGIYFEMASSGFAWGRGALRWLWEMPR